MVRGFGLMLIKETIIIALVYYLQINKLLCVALQYGIIEVRFIGRAERSRVWRQTTISRICAMMRLVSRYCRSGGGKGAAGWRGNRTHYKC